MVEGGLGGFEHDECFEQKVNLADLVKEDLEFDGFFKADLDFFLLEIEDELTIAVDVVDELSNLKRLLECLQDLGVSDVENHLSVEIHNFEHRRLH